MNYSVLVGGGKYLRLLYIIILVFCFAAKAQAQPTNLKDYSFKDQKITLRFSGETLGVILNKIAEEAKINFVYNTTLSGINERTTVNFTDESVESILHKLLAGQSIVIRYEINNTIYIEPIAGAKRPATASVRVSGRVITAKEKEPLIGATVMVLENNGTSSKNGVSCDIHGKFDLEVPYKASIAISFVGYDTQTMQITGSKNDLLIVMVAGNDIDEVVVTGMGKRSKTSFTGGYIEVKGDDLRRMDPTNILKGLQYFDPSFKILDNNARGSDPNAELAFQLRGDQTLARAGAASSMELMLDNVSSRPNSPLFVLDGFPVSVARVMELDPQRVESITILKDAAATAIYGSKAANGVIVVETKVAPDGLLSISYAGGVTLQTPDLSDYNLCTAEEKLQLEWMAGVYNPANVSDMNRYNQYKRNVVAGVNSYWLSQPLRTAVQHRHSLTAAGGTEVFRYTLGVNAGFSPGVMKASSNKNKNVNFNMSYRKKKWTVGASITLADTRGDNSPYGSFSAYTQTNPYYPIYNADGGYDRILDNKGIGAGSNYMPIANPLYNSQFKSINFTKNLNLSNSLNLEFAAMENLRFTAQVNYVRGIASTENFKSAMHTDFINELDLTKRGSYNKSTGEMMNWSTNVGVNYNLPVGRHMFNLFANWQVNEDKSNYVNFSATGYPNENMSDFIFGNKMNTSPSGSEETTRAMGFTGQVSYSYDNRYSAEFNLRGDISSQFGADNRMAPFWSAGVRWNAHSEKWLRGRIPHLEFRATYGITGSQSYAPYQAIEFYSFDGMMIPYESSEVLGAIMKGLGNPNLGWSKTDDLNFSVVLGLWKNRLNFSFSYYDRITRQMLVNYNLAPSTGFTAQMINAGELQNKGYDLNMNLIVLQDSRRNINWTIGVNANHNENKIRKISNGLKEMNAEQLKSDKAPLPIYVEGQSTSTLFLVRSLGIDPATGEEVFLTRDGKRTLTWNPVDKVPVGNTTPKLSGSLHTSFNWKNLNLGLAFSYSIGAKIYNNTLVDKIENREIGYNTDRRALTSRWTKPGDVTLFKKFNRESSLTPQSTRFLATENYLRMGSVSVGYRLVDSEIKLLRKMHISVANISFTTNDLFRISTIREERGLDYPFARSYTVSLSLLFR